jgi:hypothetical protein
MQLITITTATNNNYAGVYRGFGMWRVDCNAPSNDVAFTGLLAGFDGQIIRWRNVGTTYNQTFNLENSGSDAANRISGPGSNFVVLPGNSATLIYELRTARWSIG